MQQPNESAGPAGMLLHTNGKFTMGNWNHLFTRTIVFLTDLRHYLNPKSAWKIVPLFVWGRLHTEASQKKWKKG
jgi:hypothetical protein